LKVEGPGKGNGRGRHVRGVKILHDDEERPGVTGAKGWKAPGGLSGVVLGGGKKSGDRAVFGLLNKKGKWGATGNSGQ